MLLRSAPFHPTQNLPDPARKQSRLHRILKRMQRAILGLFEDEATETWAIVDNFNQGLIHPFQIGHLSESTSHMAHSMNSKAYMMIAVHPDEGQVYCETNT